MKLTHALLFPALALSSAALSAPSTFDLIVGRDDPATQKKIGEVTVTHDSDQLNVHFHVTRFDPTDPSDNWCLNTIRLDVATSVADIPQDDGVPLPDEFHYKDELNCVRDHTMIVPLDLEPGMRLAIAAKADAMRMGGIDTLPQLLPETATVNVVRTDPVPASYFRTTVKDDGFLNGTYDGWCIDSKSHIDQGKDYFTKIYSSYGSIPAGLVDHSDRFALVNWIVNQKWVGNASPGGHGIYTYGDVQRAIWSLLEDNPGEGGLGNWSQARADEIAAAAWASGTGFKPSCEQSVAILFVPVNDAGSVVSQTTVTQATLTQLHIPCTPATATGWVGEIPFPCKGKECRDSEAVWFEYEVN